MITFVEFKAKLFTLICDTLIILKFETLYFPKVYPIFDLLKAIQRKLEEKIIGLEA
mgnify:CR=1 FL=1